MELSTSQTKAGDSKPALQKLIEEAAKEAADEVHERNKRMGWPLIVSEPAAQEEEQKP